MGVMHHAMTGTGAVAIAAAAAIPGNLVSECMNQRQSNSVIFGHPSGILEVGAKAICTNKEWVVTQVNMSRTARRIMEGFVRIPKLSPLSK
jgi:2-methylaconitate cis-trans-isomerase PrpF